MKRNRLLHMLGLARRAGAVAVGTDAARTAVRRGQAKMVLLATDAAMGQSRKLKPLLEHRGVPHRVWGLRDELGGAIGTAQVSALAITEKSFAEQVLSRLDNKKAERRIPEESTGCG